MYDLAQDFYPELLVIINNKLHFKDFDISKHRLVPKRRIQSYELVGTDISLFLYFNNNSDYTGTLIMDYDFKLSDSAIISLYKHSIKICYKDSRALRANVFGFVTYDSRVDLMRRYTISNIIT